MKKKLILSVLGLIGFTSVQAQLNLSGHFYGQDAYRFSRQFNYGTSRSLGMGGAFVSLGGDASNMVSNPAGLGFYNKSEFSISPIFKNSNVNSNYIGNTTSLASSTTNIGQASVVFNSPGYGTRKKRSSFGVSYTRLADYANDYTYSGRNEVSSITDFFAEKANQRNVAPSILSNEFDVNAGKPTSATSLYYNSYLIDHDNLGYFVKEQSFPVNQSGRVTESGNLGQFNLAYGVNYDDKTYIGASLGIQNLNYNILSSHSESYPNADFFNSFNYYDNLIVRGGGVNLALGAIIKATEHVRLGVNVVTPTVLKVKETFLSGINSNPTSSYQINNANLETVPNDFDYRITSPLKANFGASVMLPKKLGFVSAEAEYMAFGKMNVRDRNSPAWSTEQKREIGNVYKDVLNYKLGAEIRLSNYRLRSGFNYQTSALKQSDFDQNGQAFYSVGAGYRNAKIYVDLGFIMTKNMFAYTPYVLSDDKAYSSVLLNSRQNTLSISIGSFF